MYFPPFKYSHTPSLQNTVQIVIKIPIFFIVLTQNQAIMPPNFKHKFHLDIEKQKEQILLKR